MRTVEVEDSVDVVWRRYQHLPSTRPLDAQHFRKTKASRCFIVLDICDHERRVLLCIRRELFEEPIDYLEFFGVAGKVAIITFLVCCDCVLDVQGEFIISKVSRASVGVQHRYILLQEAASGIVIQGCSSGAI